MIGASRRFARCAQSNAEAKMPTQNAVVDRIPVNESFSTPASDESVGRAAAALTAHGFEVHVVDTGAQARDLALSLIPDGSEVGQGASITLDRIGVTEVVNSSPRFVAVRPRIRNMDRATQGGEIRRLGSAPDVQLNSVQAITEDGSLLVGSFTGSQTAPISYGAGRVILVAGIQKIVPDIAAGLRRIEEYSYPLEDARMQEAFGRHSAINRVLILKGEAMPGRTAVILVRETVGI
jgi:LUD domain